MPTRPDINRRGRKPADASQGPERETVDHASAEPIPGIGHDQAVRKDQRGQEQPADKRRAQKNK